MTSQDELTISLPRINTCQVLEKIILGGIFFILALPLLGDYGMWLFPIGRDITFKLIAEFLLLVYLALLFYKKRLARTFFSPIAISLVSFWIIMALATIFSVQQEFSIWGNIYKNQGLMTWTHYILFFFLLISFLKERRHWNFLVHAAIFIGTIVGLIALWQVSQSGLDLRATSTLNNPNYLSAYLILILPITFAFFLKNKSLLLGSAAVIQFLTLVFTQTRGGYLGIAVAIFIFALLYTRRKKIIMAAALIAALWLVIILSPLGQNFQQKLPNFTDRFLNRQTIISNSGPRIEAWQAGWQGMLKRPLLGYGPENFFVAFDEHYSGSQDHSGSLAEEGSLWESWFDKAHNFIFDIGATTGFVGLLAYMAIFASAVFVLLKKVLSIRYQVSSIISIGLISAFSGYLAQNLLGFDTIVPGIYLMFLLGFSHFVTNQKLKRANRNWKLVIETRKQKLVNKFLQSSNFHNKSLISIQQISKRLGFRILLLCVILAALYLFIFSFRIHIDILRANHQLNLGESLALNVGVKQAFAAFEKGLEYNAPPVNPNLRRRYAVIALAYYDAVENRCDINLSGSDPDKLNCKHLLADSKKYLTRALELQKENAAAEWPRFTRNYIYAAQISHILGDYESSDLYFEKALDLSVGRTSIQTEWIRLREERKNIKK